MPNIPDIAALADINDLIGRGALFYVSHSGGKDSQAMYVALSRIAPANQIIVVHADLGEVEWHGVQDHIHATISHPLNVVRAGKTFFDMVRHRARTRPDVAPFPSSTTRQCTSDLKRDPIYKFIRNDMKARGASLALNCTGLRAEESPNRAKKEPLKLNARLSKSGREVWDYLPIQHLTTAQVFSCIRSAGQTPFWAYRGNKRLSCVFCIMACDSDLKHGAEQRPELAKAYMDLEEETGWTMFNGRSLRDRIRTTEKAA
ncbi:phosphoadenosine phosphosulfate reductase family protein [Roseibium aggregatum]|uniref:phosphoadenosine phosphosulfate reductase domain-containing protein n=1 Tax=Roseibium aggregatum TaxID=187304 RepID=UPI001E3A8832|nr:phosphoadenosine phosphosulfate reductase family protein [Roseibium aggregatum]UES40966.1 phosphoadenosine phosphosulfate reductase family protein [Roseibium aggregatum]